LKAVPWTDLVQAAPSIVKGARKLFSQARGNEQATNKAATAPGGRGTTDERLHGVEAAVQRLGTEQQASAELIRSLAEQNARVVETMAILQARQRILLGVCAALTVAFVVLVVWVATR